MCFPVEGHTNSLQVSSCAPLSLSFRFLFPAAACFFAVVCASLAFAFALFSSIFFDLLLASLDISSTLCHDLPRFRKWDDAVSCSVFVPSSFLLRPLWSRGVDSSVPVGDGVDDDVDCDVGEDGDDGENTISASHTLIMCVLVGSTCNSWSLSIICPSTVT